MRELSKKLQDYLIEFINLKEGEFLIVRDNCEALKKLRLLLLALGQNNIEIKNCEELICKKEL
ncbi:MAG: hypothetical protein QW232_02370 [Saccharolobus sp.]